MRSLRESKNFSEEDHQTLLADGLPIFEWSPGVPILYDEQQVTENLD